MEYYQKALRIWEDLGAQRGIADMLNRVGSMIRAQGRYSEALEYHEQSLKIFETLDDKEGISDVRFNIGEIHRLEGRYQQALDQYKEDLKISTEIGSRDRMAGAMTDIGRTYLHLQRFDEAVAMADSSYKLAVEIGNVGTTMYAAELLSDAYEAVGDYENAYKYHKEYATLKDSLINEENVKSINEMEAKYEAEKREQQIALLEKDKTLQDLELQRQQEELLRHRLEARQQQQMLDLLAKEQEIQSLTLASTDAELEKQRAENEAKRNEVELLTKDKKLQASLLERETMMRNFFIAGLIVALVLAGGLYSRYRYKKRTGEELQRSYDELQRAQQQLIHAEKMATLGELTAGVAHEIKNPLNFVNNFTSMNKELVEELEEYANGNDDILEVAELLKGNTAKILEHGTRADSIVQGMLMHSRETKGVRQQADINDLVKEAVALAEHGSPTGKGADVTLNLSDATGSAEVLPAEISRVILNLVGNSSYAVKKHADDTGIEPEITVSTERVDNTVRIVVADNGPGIAPDVREKIFQPFFTTKPTGDGTGLGLSLSWDIIVNGHNGTIEVESEEGKGARFIVELPAEA